MRWGTGILLVVVAVIAVAGYAIGAGGSSKDLVLCATKKSGDLSLAGGKGKCAKDEKKLTVAKEGPVGPVGPQGAAGAPDSDSPEPVTYVKSPATTACQAQPGTFCAPGSLSGEWENFKDTFGSGDYERTGYFKDGEGFVHLVGVAGWISSGGVGGGFVPEGPFYLPPGYRPAATEMFLVPSGHAEGGTLGGYDRVEIRPDGLVWTPGNLISLSPIVFKAK
jgi:hypothetical protein